MKLFQAIKKFIFHARKSGLKYALKESIYFNRTMVVIEKDITKTPEIATQDYIFLVLDQSNYNKYSGKYQLNNLDYYCKKGAKCMLALKDETCVGYQWWTVDSEFIDLKKLDLKLNKGEAYLFDFYVLPEYRGTEVPKHITIEAFNYLQSQNIHKIFGYFFSDNIKAMWWHRAFLKCEEIKEVKIHRFFLFEFAQGRMFFNLL